MNSELFKQGNIYFLPSLHGRMEFAVAARQAWDELKPDAVAVELPKSLTVPVKETVARLPNLSVVFYPEGEGVRYLLIEPIDAAMECLRRAEEESVPSFLIDAEAGGYPEVDELWPDPYALSRLGLGAFVEPFMKDPPGPAEPDAVREGTMAHRLQELDRRYERVLFVCGLGHAGRIRRLLETPQPLPLGSARAKEAQPANLDPDSIPECASETPHLIRAFEDWRGEASGRPPDRLLRQEALLKEAAEAFEKETGEEIKPWQYKVMRRFRRNWAVLSGRLAADFYQLVVSAKAVGGDEFAYQVWEKAIAYPFTDLEPGWETIRLTAEDLGLNQKRVSFFKPLRRTRRRLVPLPGRQRAREGRPGEWREIWERGSGACSFPPEDVVVEDFGRDAARKALHKLAESNRSVEPFLTSLRDGIDIRETMRRLAEKRIYVYEDRAVGSKVDAVIVIFDEDRGEKERFPWRLTWLGEHQDESDMALYATPPGADLVGPGVSRCLYGGMVMTYPPMRMLDIWSDPFFDMARTKPERLLLAGADYSRERIIAYIARRPPSSRMRSLVKRLGHRIAFLPLGTFPPGLIQRIRTFHVLSGHEVRQWAGEYIGGPKGFRGKAV